MTGRLDEPQAALALSFTDLLHDDVSPAVFKPELRLVRVEKARPAFTHLGIGVTFGPAPIVSSRLPNHAEMFLIGGNLFSFQIYPAVRPVRRMMPEASSARTIAGRIALISLRTTDLVMPPIALRTSVASSITARGAWVGLPSIRARTTVLHHMWNSGLRYFA